MASSGSSGSDAAAGAEGEDTLSERRLGLEADSSLSTSSGQAAAAAAMPGDEGRFVPELLARDGWVRTVARRHSRALKSVSVSLRLACGAKGKRCGSWIKFNGLNKRGTQIQLRRARILNADQSIAGSKIG